MSQGKRLLVMAGGTGGHVFPALAVAQALKEKNWDICWLGTQEKMEARLVPQHGFPIEFVKIQGVRGHGIFRKLLTPLKVLQAIAQSRKVIKKFQPDLVLGMGGFVSGPGGVAAWLSNVPLVIHEQNAVPGLTNKLLSRISSVVMSAFPNTFDSSKTRVVGNPIRQDLLKLYDTKSNSSESKLKILVVGGSLGAKVFNDKLPSVFASVIEKNNSIEIKHQVGRKNAQSVEQAYKNLNCQNYVQVSEFIDDMAAGYSWADVVICRAGALTVSELSVVGTPSILIPFPFAVDDHQTKNAEVLSNAGAALLMQQSKWSDDYLVEQLLTFIAEPDKLAAMRAATKTIASLHATDDVVKICIESTKEF